MTGSEVWLVAVVYLIVGSLTAAFVWRWIKCPDEEPRLHDMAALGLMALLWPVLVPVGLIGMGVVVAMRAVGWCLGGRVR